MQHARAAKSETRVSRENGVSVGLPCRCVGHRVLSQCPCHKRAAERLILNSGLVKPTPSSMLTHVREAPGRQAARTKGPCGDAVGRHR